MPCSRPEKIRNESSGSDPTITESAGINVQVAVDPEMLGRIFENLLAEAIANMEDEAWLARLFKSRTLAAEACAGHHVRANGAPVLKAGHLVKIGDVLTFLRRTDDGTAGHVGLYVAEDASAFHVLGGKLSALDGVRPEDLRIDALVRRVGAGGIDEVVLAMNATLEGQTTAHYLMDALEPFGVKVTRLAHGVPVGGELDYLDEGTLAAALERRSSF